MLSPQSLFDAPRILVLLSSLRVAGAELQAIRYGKFLQAESGASVDVLGLGPPGDLVEHLTAAALTWRAVPPACGEEHFASLLRKARPDIILAFDWPMNLAGARHWRGSGARMFVWNQRDAGGFGPDGELRAAIPGVPLFLPNSGHARDYLIRTLGADPRRVIVVPNVISLPPPAEPRAGFRKRYGLGSRLAAVMVANIHGRKDHPTLLHAWARMKADWVHGVCPALLLAGRIDDPVIPRLAAELGLADDVLFLGPRRDVSSVLYAADFAVYSSRSEGFPNGVLEAMAAGLAVAATDIPGIREALAPSGHALLAPAGDSGALARCILQLAANAGLRHSLGTANLQTVAAFLGDYGAAEYAKAVFAGAGISTQAPRYPSPAV